jgi:hypothetical protein
MLARDPLVPVRAAAAGAALGAAALVRPTALVIAVACLAWLLMPIVREVRLQTDRQAARARALASAAMFTAVGILVMSATRQLVGGAARSADSGPRPASPTTTRSSPMCRIQRVPLRATEPKPSAAA